MKTHPNPFRHLNFSSIGAIGVFLIFSLFLTASCKKSGGITTIAETLTVTSHTPTDKKTGVSVDKVIVVYFDRGLKAATVTNDLVLLESPTDAVPRTVSYDSAAISITPDAPLLYGTEYTVTIKRGVLSRGDAQLAADYVFTFTTQAIPLFTSTVPINNATRVAVDINITATFPKALDPATLSSATFYLKATNNIISATVTNPSPNIAKLNPTSNLTPGTLYTATLTTGLKYLSGDAYPATSTWSFKTAPSPWSGIKQVGSANIDYGYGIAIDSLDNVYVTGFASGDIGAEVSDAKDILLLKYNVSGVRQYAKLFGTAGTSLIDEEGKAVKIDRNDMVYVTGYTLGTLDANPNQGGMDAFITQFNAAGTVQWSEKIASAGDEEAFDMTLRQGTNISAYITGYTTGDLGMGNSGLKDIFLAKFNDSGLQSWVRTLGSAQDDVGLGVAVDSSGDVYVAGYTDGALDGNSSNGGRDIFLTKYDKNGFKQWTTQYGTAQDEEALSVAVDATGDVYLTGYSKGTLTGGADIQYSLMNTHTDTNPSPGTKDIIISKISPAGVLQWNKQQAGTGAVNEEGREIIFDSTGDFYVVGYTQGQLSYFVEDNDFADTNGNVFFSHYYSAVYFNARYTRQTGTVSAADQGWGIALDSVSDVFVTGNTAGTLGVNANAGADDVFIIKGDATGDFQ
ncbi:MAG: Ig-like domain-containing protein [Deltaproteobacteria bacterium]|nr:Ig-like domain-containing protein [Deltaproteobacteria bacterium]